MDKSEYLEGRDFSIVLGGPFFQLLNRAHLAGKALELVKKRVIVLAIITWLPLFLLSILKGQAWGEGTNLPFVQDIDVHVRFLLALPLFVMAELLVHQRLVLVVNEFQKRELIPETQMAKFHNAISSALRLRNSVVAEIVMVIIIYVIGYQLVWNQTSALGTTAWYSDPAVGNGRLSLAGIWFRYVSLPIFQFLFLRWYYRIFIWARFLFHVSRIRLRLVPTHPDHVGGLGFLANSIYAMMPLAFAHGVMLLGMISNHIFHEDAELLDFKVEIISAVVLVMCLMILPLFFFASQLGDAKRKGGLEYGQLASRFVQEFEATWINGKGPVVNTLIGKDIQSLADLANSYKVVESMQIVPLTRSTIIMLVVVTVIPLFPLVLTMMPLSELLKMLSGILF
ncbi:MAG TPA: hypothetical protein VF141_16015 [Chryseolinea sp.]